MKKVTKIDKIQNVTNQKQKLRVAAYCRVSTSNDAQLESLETQKAHYESSMMFLRDDDLKVAFVTVLNKLIYSHKLVLKPYAAALQNNSGDENLVRIQHLERLLEQNTEQRETLTRLMAQGYIDQVLYNSETNALLTQANTYREDIEVINTTMNGDSSRFFEAERLLHFAERGSMLEEYSEDLFKRFVDHIQVYSRHEVGFVMKCGLTFKEMI